jgi:hypothetical protein
MRSLLAVPALAAFALLTPPGRPRRTGSTLEEAIQSSEASIVDTPTPPGPRRIDVNRWEDLLQAAESLGRPILRLHGSGSGREERLFYVADGPQSYVFDFSGPSMDVTRSGAFVELHPPAPIPAPAPPAAAPADALRLPATPSGLPHAPPQIFPAVPVPAIPAAAESVRSDSGADAEGPEQVAERDLPSATVVEQRIREVIHELLAAFRTLPPSSDRLELGTEHIQRAVDMLHLGRYGAAQVELDKAARLLREESPR